jgi:hypothetical protein
MKNMRNIRLWFLAIWICLSCPAISQTLAQDLTKVKNRFTDPAPIQATIDLRYFKNEKDASAAITKKGLLKRWGNDHYHSVLDGKEYLINKRYTLFVDRANKLMVLKNTDPSPKNRAQELSIPEVDKNQEEKYHISRVVSGEMTIYTVVEKNNPLNRFKMELDMGASRLRKITYYGGNSYARTEISYAYTSQVVFTEKDFAEGKYFTKTQKTFTPTAAYAGYELNNQTR